jgi:D-serine deaminase-like pyridoxal phosphate-dependent protein
VGNHSARSLAVNASALETLDTPAVIVDLDVVRANLAKMQELCDRHAVRLRPHAKTHKSPYFGRMQLDGGARGLTVAKLEEAAVFVDAGVDDVLVAYPIVGTEKLRRLEGLLRRAQVTVSVDSVEAAEGLAALGRRRGDAISVYVEVDTGLGRLGLLPGPPTRQLVRSLAQLRGIKVVGLMTHGGHGAVADADEKRRIGRHEGESLVATAALLQEDGIDVGEISVGSTPTAPFVAEVPGVTELRPGTYIFHDVDMVAVGAADWSDCAVTVAATVVSRPGRDRAVIDAGSKTLSSDRAFPPATAFGRVVHHEDVEVSWLNEEHGVLTVPPHYPLAIGDRVRIVPNHVCQVINLSDSVTLVDSSGVVGDLPVEARGKRR